MNGQCNKKQISFQSQNHQKVVVGKSTLNQMELTPLDASKDF